MVVVLRVACDAVALASSAGGAAMDVCAAQRGPSEDGQADIRTGAAARAGESDLGLPAHPWRTDRARDQACAEHDLGDPAPAWDRAGGGRS
jgi:hypothetical protein